MSCREFVEFLDAYLAGELPPSTIEAFNAHLAQCPSCVSYTNSYREAVRLGRAALQSTDEGVPPTVPEALVRAILAARSSESR